MNLKYKIEEIENLSSLSPRDKELVLKEYWKEEHPFQIECKIWRNILPFLLILVVLFYFSIFENTFIKSNTLEFFLINFICMIFCGFIVSLVEVKIIAPIVIRRIIKSLDKIRINEKSPIKDQGKW